jgi:hypothetical protein
VELGFGLGIACERQLAAVGGRHVHVDHLHGGELPQDAAWRQARRQSMQAPREGDVQAMSLAPAFRLGSELSTAWSPPFGACGDLA